MARNGRGEKVPARDPSATQWCSLGAIYKQDQWRQPSTAVRAAANLLEVAAWALGKGSVASINDHSSHEEVVEMWDKAIEKVKEV